MPEKMSNIEIYAAQGRDDNPRKYTFSGRLLVVDEKGRRVLAAYETAKGRILVHDDYNGRFQIYNDIDELEGNYSPEFVVDIAEELGQKRTIRLDI